MDDISLNLLALLVVLMVIAVVQLGRIVSLLKAAAKVRASPVEPTGGNLSELKQEERAAKRHFDEFLAEDSGRAQLSKSEQSAAFRQWRQDRGYTWGR